VESRLILDIVIRKGAAIAKLLASENQTLLIRGILHDDKRITAVRHQTLLTLPCLGSWL